MKKVYSFTLVCLAVNLLTIPVWRKPVNKHRDQYRIQTELPTTLAILLIIKDNRYDAVHQQ